MMKANCACGAVIVELAVKPEYINLCDCTLCAPMGGAWGYYKAAQVQITGDTRGYRRVEQESPVVEMRFCPTCGTTTHWVLTENFPDAEQADSMGVNMRIFTPDQVAGIEARMLDGRGWDQKAEPAHRRPPGILGQDVFL